MATPVGNPQNLFLYSAYDLSAGQFFAVTLPLTALSLAGLSAAALFVLPKKLDAPQLEKASLQDGKKLAVYGVLFLLGVREMYLTLPVMILCMPLGLNLVVYPESLGYEKEAADNAKLNNPLSFFFPQHHANGAEKRNQKYRKIFDAETCHPKLYR